MVARSWIETVPLQVETFHKRREWRTYLCLMGETRCGQAPSDMYAAAVMLSPAAATHASLHASLHAYHNLLTVCFYWENIDLKKLGFFSLDVLDWIWNCWTTESPLTGPCALKTDCVAFCLIPYVSLLKWVTLSICPLLCPHIFVNLR